MKCIGKLIKFTLRLCWSLLYVCCCCCCFRLFVKNGRKKMITCFGVQKTNRIKNQSFRRTNKSAIWAHQRKRMWNKFAQIPITVISNAFLEPFIIMVQQRRRSWLNFIFIEWVAVFRFAFIEIRNSKIDKFMWRLTSSHAHSNNFFSPIFPFFSYIFFFKNRTMEQTWKKQNKEKINRAISVWEYKKKGELFNI